MRRDRSGADDGTTLVEMLVTMVVVGLLGMAITITVSALTHHTIATKARDYATEQAQVVLDRTSRLLRAATPEGAGNSSFTFAGDNHVTFYSDLSQPNGPALVDLNVTGPATSGTLTQTVTQADLNSSYTYTGTPSVGSDGHDIDTTAGPVFTYYDASGNVLATPMTTVAQTIKIARIQVNVVAKDPGGSTPVTDGTLIYLRNVEYSGN